MGVIDRNKLHRFVHKYGACIFISVLSSSIAILVWHSAEANGGHLQGNDDSIPFIAFIILGLCGIGGILAAKFPAGWYFVRSKIVILGQTTKET